MSIGIVHCYRSVLSLINTLRRGACRLSTTIRRVWASHLTTLGEAATATLLLSVRDQSIESCVCNVVAIPALTAPELLGLVTRAGVASHLATQVELIG